MGQLKLHRLRCVPVEVLLEVLVVGGRQRVPDADLWEQLRLSDGEVHALELWHIVLARRQDQVLQVLRVAALCRSRVQYWNSGFGCTVKIVTQQTCAARRPAICTQRPSRQAEAGIKSLFAVQRQVQAPGCNAGLTCQYCSDSTKWRASCAFSVGRYLSTCEVRTTQQISFCFQIRHL